MDSASDTPIIELRGLTKSYGFGDAEFFALNGINLSVKRGEFIAIMGPSGCGKTSLLNTIGLLDNDFQGEYELEGKDITSMSKRKHAYIRSKQIGFIFQNHNLVPRMNVIENVALPLNYKGVPKTRRLIMASNILKNFNLGTREYYMPYQLSGGQAQRVAIARALVSEPTIILADEPTGSLDTRSSHTIMEELSTLHRLGNTIIMVTHNPALCSYASRVITMLDGQIETDSLQKPSPNSEDAATIVEEPKKSPRKKRRKTTAKKSRRKKK